MPSCWIELSVALPNQTYLLLCTYLFSVIAFGNFCFGNCFLVIVFLLCYVLRLFHLHIVVPRASEAVHGLEGDRLPGGETEVLFQIFEHLV